MNSVDVQTAEFCTSIPTFPAPAMSSQEAEGWAQGSGVRGRWVPAGHQVPAAMVGTEDICVAGIDMASSAVMAADKEEQHRHGSIGSVLVCTKINHNQKVTQEEVLCSVRAPKIKQK